MLPTPEEVRQYISDNLNCEHIEVAGDGSHFEAIIVSPEFAGKRLIALGERMKSEIHALSMRTLTPDEHNANTNG